MILFARTASIAPGKNAEAMTFAQEICGYVKEVVGVDVALYTPIGGNPLRIGWLADYDNLQALDDAFEKLAGDSGYNDRIQEAGSLFIAGSLEDTIWKSVG
jgi:hypothetical protein